MGSGYESAEQAAAKLDELERRAQQVVEDIFKAGAATLGGPDGAPSGAVALASESIDTRIRQHVTNPVKDSLNVADAV